MIKLQMSFLDFERKYNTKITKKPTISPRSPLQIALRTLEVDESLLIPLGEYNETIITSQIQQLKAETGRVFIQRRLNVQDGSATDFKMVGSIVFRII